MPFRNSKACSLLRGEAVSRGWWEIRGMVLKLFLHCPPHFPSDFQMRCSVSSWNFSWCFPSRVPVPRQGPCLCCFHCSPCLYALSTLVPPVTMPTLSHDGRLQLQRCFQLCPGHLHPKSPHSQISRPRAKLGCFLLNLHLPCFASP